MHVQGIPKGGKIQIWRGIEATSDGTGRRERAGKGSLDGLGRKVGDEQGRKRGKMKGQGLRTKEMGREKEVPLRDGRRENRRKRRRLEVRFVANGRELEG